MMRASAYITPGTFLFIRSVSHLTIVSESINSRLSLLLSVTSGKYRLNIDCAK